MTDSDCAASARVMHGDDGLLKTGSGNHEAIRPRRNICEAEVADRIRVVRAGEEFAAVGCKRIVALGITAPEGSCTVPDTTAEDCLKTEAEATQRRRIRMESFRPGT